MGSLAKEEIKLFLQKLGERFHQPATVYLLGGSALCFWGNPRRTIAIDLTVDTEAIILPELFSAIETLADEIKVEQEIVPIEEFIPLPRGAGERHQWIGRFGSILVYSFDPYSIALSKLARGLETDIQDVIFLLQQDIISIRQLAEFVEEAMPLAWDYDIFPSDLRSHFDEIKRLYRQ